ncbi:MAG: hypothetical protein AAF611_19730 [Bacteroidota bacterium]
MIQKKNKTIEETIAEVQRKDKRYNYMILVVGLLLIMLVAGMIFYGQYKKKMQAIEHQQLELETKERELIALELESKELSQDSILNLVKSIQNEIAQIRRNSAAISKEELLTKLDVAQTKLEKISFKVNHKPIVQYFQCKGDGTTVENALKNMDDFNVSVRTSEKYSSDASVGSNTIWFGKDIDKKEVYKLIRKLEAQNITIQNIVPIPDTKQNTARQNTIAVGYKPTPKDQKAVTVPSPKPTLVRSIRKNMKYTIRFYSYNPNNSVKKELITFFNEQEYKVKAYPDWKSKPSFFASVPTIFYYDSETRDVAKKMAATLQENVGVTFKIQLGNGYGIDEEEKDNTFIVHYIQ